jgi:ABC-type glycerol-3-phosphate transport system substrate-binding protein
MTLPVPLTRRTIAGRISGVGAGLLAAACGPFAAKTQDTQLSGPKITLRFMGPAGASGIEESVNAMLPSWEAKHPNIGVEWTYGNMSQLVIVHAAAGDIEDIVTGFMGAQAPQVWFTSGILIALDSLVRTQRVNPRDWYKAVWDAHFVDGKQFSIPWQGQVFGLGFYFNKDAFDQAAIKYPDLSWTLDSVTDAAEKLRIVQGGEVRRWGALMGEGLSGERFPAVARNFNAEAFTPDQRRFIWGEGPEFLRCLTWYTEMMQRRVGVLYSPGGDRDNMGLAAGDRAIVGLAEGKVAMMFKGWMGGVNVISNAVRDNPNARYGMTFAPKGPTGRRGGRVTSASTSVTALSKHPDQAFQFILEFTGREWSVARGLQKTGSTTLNGRPDVYHDPRLQQDPNLPKEVAETKAKSMDFTEKDEDCSYVRAVPWNLQGAEFHRLQGLTTAKIFTGDAPASQDMVTELRRLMEPVMQAPRPFAGG